jgi:hypothetical protein
MVSMPSMPAIRISVITTAELLERRAHVGVVVDYEDSRATHAALAGMPFSRRAAEISHE